jgi:protein involved in sex pheromone biosynthesis
MIQIKTAKNVKTLKKAIASKKQIDTEYSSTLLPYKHNLLYSVWFAFLAYSTIFVYIN